jgi:hypothetical protein
MSAREEQPVTVPPPPGEDDAYNAATKVGAMPAEVMAKLRAEGLLPEEDEAPPTGPGPNSVPRPHRAEGQAPLDFSNVPSLHSSAPPVAPPSTPPTPFGSTPPGSLGEKALLERLIPDRAPSTGVPPPVPRIRIETQGHESLDRDHALDTPGSTPAGPDEGEGVTESELAGLPDIEDAVPEAVAARDEDAIPAKEADEAESRDLKAIGASRFSTTQRVFVLVGALALVVVAAFLMALLSQRR